MRMRTIMLMGGLIDVSEELSDEEMEMLEKSLLPVHLALVKVT